MEDTPTYETQNFKLSENEKKEKILLDFFYLENEIETKIEDKKVSKNLKKITKLIAENLQKELNIEVSKKNISDYILLKNSNFDSDLLRLTKFLK